MKVALVVAPILDIVDSNKPFVLKINANGEGIGAVLMQGGHLVAYENKKLDHTQWNYSAYEQVLLAIIRALKKWFHYLYGVTFEVWRDHESLK